MRPTTILVLATALAAVLLAAPGCGKSSNNDTPVAAVAIADYVGLPIASAGTVTLESGSPPAASNSGAPSVTVSGNTATVKGGSGFIDVTSDTTLNGTTVNLTEVYVAVTGTSGYYKIANVNQTSVRLRMQYSTTIPVSLPLLVNGAANGGVSAQKSFTVTRLSAATDNLQVTLTWDQNSDLDLHLDETVDGTTEVIYWGARTSTHGGTLNLDSNGACSIDSVRNENIYYTSAPPNGTFTVKVDNWENCLWDDNAVPPQGKAVSWILTVRHGSDPVCTATGTFPATDRGDGSIGSDSRNNGVVAKTFTISGSTFTCNP